MAINPWDLLKLDDGDVLKLSWIVPGTKVKKPVQIEVKGDRLWFQYPFSKPITEELKASFEGCKWHGFDDRPVKQWSAKLSQHNAFRIAYMAGWAPYAPYDAPLIKYEAFGDLSEGRSRYKIFLPDGRIHETRYIYAHQGESIAHILTRHYCNLTVDMGCGKTLATMEAIEASGCTKVLWVAPRSALASVELEFRKWNSPIFPTFVTYSSLEKHNARWTPGEEVYQFVVGDEISRAKNPVAKRTIAMQYIANNVRMEHGQNGYVVGLTGTPAPKSPLDHYSISEIACPGFLKEANINKLKERMAVIHQRESATGGTYPHLITWRDSEQKCSTCGELQDHDWHSEDFAEERCFENTQFHEFVPMKNEVANLSKRLKGLVLVKLKKDCLDLPAIQYRRVKLEPSRQTLRAAKLIAKTCSSAVKALTFLRCLSDGFQYTETEIGREQCPCCKGQRTIKQPVYCGPEKTVAFLTKIGAWPSWEDPSNYEQNEVLQDAFVDPLVFTGFYKEEDVACPQCSGVGDIVKYNRSVDKVACPKVDALKDIIDQHEDVGRLVTFAGFTGSVDLCCEATREAEWHYLRVDGRGWHASFSDSKKPVELLEIFQDKKNDLKINFVGHPAAAGMGLTLHAACTEVYYSNDFSAESRQQSENRIHRPGMNISRGATIIDLIHLPSDEYVLDNLKKKKDLQSMTMGELKAFIGEDDGS